MLNIHNLSYRYPKGKVTLYKNVNLVFHPGEIYGLMGQNGEGKTTLLKLIAGLLEPKTGQITWQEQKASGREFLKNLFFLPEETDLPPLSLAKYVHLLSPLYPEFSSEMFEQICQRFQLEQDKPMHKMSFGQKKKSLLAIGLATQAPLLILDEPTNGLDVQSKAILRELLLEMKSDQRTILISTHQARDLQEIISGLCVLHHNEIVFNHTLSFMQQHLNMVMQGEEGAFYQGHLGGLTQSLIASNGQAGTHLDLEFIFLAATDGTNKIQNYLGACAKEGV
jgi:ABC-2 type transport system ATP-binding protein